jgi:hypothetical protein
MKHKKKMHPETAAPNPEQFSNTVTKQNQESGKVIKENNPTSVSFREQKETPPKEETTSAKSEHLKEEIKNRKPGEDVDPKQSLSNE